MAAGKRETPAHNEPSASRAVPVVGMRACIAVLPRSKENAIVDWRQRQISRQAKRQPAGQQEAIPWRKTYSARSAFHCQPTLSGDNGIALNAFMLWELHSHLSIHTEATRHIASRFQQRQYI